MDLLEFRASGVGKLMAYPDRASLPAGAITAIAEKASQIILGWQPDLGGMPAIQKGLVQEDVAIEMVNLVRGTNYTKNTVRKSNGLITGECDIYCPETKFIGDIKNAFSKKTFPMFIGDGDKRLYEWQLVAYMELWQANKAEIIYTLVDTPEELIPRFEPTDWHLVSHIDPKQRITGFLIEKSQEKQEQLLARVKLAQDKLKEMLADRGFDWQALEIEF